MTVLKKETIGSGIEKVAVATKFAKGIDINTGKQTTVATEVKTMYSHSNHIFNLDGLKYVFEDKCDAERQLRYINTLYDICQTTDRAILLFSLNNTTVVLLRYTVGNQTKIAEAWYNNSTGTLSVVPIDILVSSNNIEEIATTLCEKQDKFSDWRWLTINANQSPNKRRLTIADALSRR